MFNKIDSSSNNNLQQKNNNNNDLKVVFQSLGIPLQLCQIYERIGLTQLYAWQSECLYTTNVLRGNNLVYCAPTSGGKTLVAELVLLKTVLSLQKKAIFILPFVSLVLEKEKHINKILQQYNQSLPKNQQIQVEAYYGEKGMSSRSSSRENIIICTIEKANMIFNTMVLRKRANSIGCFIFDETHVLGNKMNGYLLEILITKIKLYELNENKRIMEEMSRMQQHPHHTTVDPFHIQIIALSATMGNVSELANWLQAKLFITNFRPIPLVERIKAGNEIYSTTGELTEQIPPIFNTMPFQKEDPDHLTFLTSVGLQKGQQIILFCPTKQQCVSVAEMLLKMFTLLSTEGNNRNQNPQKQIQTSLCHEKNIQKQQEILLQRKRIVDELFGSSDEKNGGPEPAPAPPVVTLTKQQSILKEILLAGIAFHHSSLTPMERIVIEKAFRQGWISVLCATTTLAAGVNLPAGRIIIRSLTLGKDSLSITNYKQMAGRAGRMGQTSYGESFLVVRSNQKQDALNLVNQSMPNIQSQIHPENDGGNAIVKAMIDLVGLEIIQTSQDLLSFIHHTLLYQQQQQQPPGEVKESNTKHLNLMELVQNCYSFILENKIIDAKPFPNSSPLAPIIPGTSTNYRISTTKFGRAFLRSGMDPDEAIIFYESLLLAQEHLFLDNSLHIFYLLSPLDHPFLPDCQRIFHFYQKSRKNSFSFHLLLDSIGLTEQVLHPWLINPPTKAQLELSTQMLRIRGISSSTATSSSSLGLPRSSLSLQDWKRICCLKRLWSAMILQQLSDGYSYEQILKEYSSAHNNNNNNVMMMISIQDVDNLHKNTRIIMSKLEKFCKEMNWKGLMKLFHFNKKQFEINSISSLPKEMKKLLLIPSMTKKLAKILLEHSIKNPKQFLSYSIEEIIQFIQLSCGFELQEIDENSFQLFSFANENDDDDDNNKDQEKDAAAVNQTESLNNKKKDEGGVIVPIKKTRDEMMRERLAIIVSNLLQSARALVTEVEKKKKEKEKEKLLKMAAMTNPTTIVAVYSHEDPFGDIPDSELEKFFDIQAGTIPSTSVAQTAADQRTIPAEQREYTKEIIEEEEEEEEVEEEDPLAILMESDDEDEDQNADDPSKLRMEVDSLSSFSDNDDEEDQDEELEEEDEQRKEADQDEDLDDMNSFPAERLKTQFSTFRDRTSPDENDLLSPALKLPRREDSSRRNITPQQQQQQQQSFQSPSFSSTTVKSNIHRIKITPFKQSPADPLAHPVFASPLAGNQQELLQSHISSNPATRETDTDEIEFYLSDADLLKVLEEFENKGFILPQQQPPPQNPSENNHPQTNNLSISVENYPAPSSSYSSHSHKKDRSSNPLQSIADSFIQEEEEEGIRHILSSGVHESRKFVYLPYENQIVLNQTKSLPATRLPPERSFLDAPPHSNSLSFHNDHYQEELNALNQFYLPTEGLHEIEITMNVVHQPDFLKDAATIADHHHSNIDENNHAQQERMIVDPEEGDELPDEDLLKLMDEWERKNNPDPRELAGSSNRKLTPKNNRSSSSSHRKILNFSIVKEEEIIRTPSNNTEGDHTEITQEMNSLSHHPEVSFVFSQPGQPPLPPLHEDPDQTIILESQEDEKLVGIARVGEECEEEDDEEVFSPIPINLDTSVIYAKKSPYLTPFTASKIPSPGKYLYYGALTHHEETFLDQSILMPDHDSNEAVSIKATEQQQQPSLSSSIPMIKPQRVDYSQMNLLNYFTMQLSFQSFQIHDLSSPRSTADGNWKHCDEFIYFLQTSKFISFELIFKQFPLKFLHAKHSSSSASASASSSSSEQVVVDPIYQGSWSSLLSYNYHPSVHITSSHLDNQIKSPLEVSITAPTTSPTATSSKNPQANPLLLTGITFNFGSLESFHLKLPQVMPLIYSSCIYSNPPPSSASLLEQLPMKLKERICLFIGFPHFLYQSAYLYQFLQSRQQQSGSPSRSSSSSSLSKLVMRKESNNLFLVSKFWCFYCRQLLIYEWRKGGCYEWKLVQEIMNSSELIKIGSNLKAKLQFLRDRDIFLAGIAEDPVIAVDLLKNSGDIHCPTPITTTTTASSTASTRMNDEEEVQEESSASSDRILQKKKAMATATAGSNKKNSLSFYPLTVVPKFQLQEFLQAFHPKIQSIVQFHMTATFPSSSSSSFSSSTMLNNFYFLPPKQSDSRESDENINPTTTITAATAAAPMMMTAYRESMYHSIKAIYFSAYLSFYNFYAMKLLKIELQKTFQWDLYSQIEMPLIPILSDSEYHGIEIAGIQLQIIRQQWIDRKQLINKLFQQFFRVSYSFNVENVDDVKKIKSFLGQLLNKIFGNPPPPPSSSTMMIPPAISPQQSGRTQPLQSNLSQLAQQQRQQSSLTDFYFQSSSTSSLSSSAAAGVYQQFQTNSSVSQKITSSDWSAGKHKRTFPDEQQPAAFPSQQSTSSTANTFPPSSSSSSSLPASLTRMREEFQENHPFTLLLHEFRSITRSLPLINAIIRNRRFSRIRGDYHPIGTETGRMIITSPPLQQTPKETLVIPGYHPTLFEEILRSTQSQQQRGAGGGGSSMNTSGQEIRNIPKEFIEMMNENNWQTIRQTGNYEWVKVIPSNSSLLLRGSSGTGSIDFYSSELFMAKLIFIFPGKTIFDQFPVLPAGNEQDTKISAILRQHFHNQQQHSSRSGPFPLPSSSLQQQLLDYFQSLPLSCDSFFDDWTQSKQFYFHSLSLPQPPVASSSSSTLNHLAAEGSARSSGIMRLIPLVLIEIPSYHKKHHHHQQQQQQCSCYQLLPAHHLYRVHSNVLPCPKEFQLLQKATTLPPSSQLPPSVTPLHHQYSNYFSTYFSEYTSLQKKYQIRQSFIASPGYILLTADYSQIELRLLTHFCKEENLLAAFNQSPSSLIENNQNHPNQKKKKEDIFERLASIYKRKPIESITKVERNEIKQLCYAVIYGAGSKLIAENMNISTEEAKQLIADFHKRFPSIQRFINELYEECAEKGYVETLFGRKRYLSFEKVIMDPKNKKDENNWKILSKLQRQVINSLCQGSAADLVKLAMVNIHKKLEELSLRRQGFLVPKNKPTGTTLPPSHNIGSNNSSGHSHHSGLFHYRTPRSHPGCGLYRQFDDCRLLLQIHDELVYEVRPQELIEVASIIKESMEKAVQLAIPLEIKLKTGMNWNDLQPYELPSFSFPPQEQQGPIAKNLFGNE